MSILGKILAVLNLFGMLGLMLLALLAYGKRQAWEYANFRHDLLAKGLPVFKEETDELGNVKTESLGRQVPKEIFAVSPVATQKEEVERVQKLLQAKLDAAENDKRQQTVLYATYLLPLAHTNADRERLGAIRRYLADEKTVAQLKSEMQQAYKDAEADKKDDKKGDKQLEWAFADRLAQLGGEPRRPFELILADLKKKDPAKTFDAAFTETLDAINSQLKEQFDREFKDVLTGNRTVEGGEKKMTPEERKDYVSLLLFNLVEVADAAEQPADAAKAPELYLNAGYKRYITVVGLAQANRTINRQAGTLNGILKELGRQTEQDRQVFAKNLLPLLDQSREVARDVAKLALEVEYESNKVREQGVLVNKRRQDVKDAEEELALHRDTMAKKLGELRKMSAEVYTIRLTLRDATLLNQEHEATIRRLEGWRFVPFAGGQFLIRREEP